MAICYKDRSYCGSSADCDRHDCYRHLSDLEFKNALNLGLPVAYITIKGTDKCPGFIDKHGNGP